MSHNALYIILHEMFVGVYNREGGLSQWFIFALDVISSQQLQLYSSHYYNIILSNVTTAVPEIIWIDTNVAIPEGD